MIEFHFLHCEILLYLSQVHLYSISHYKSVKFCVSVYRYYLSIVTDSVT